MKNNDQTQRKIYYWSAVEAYLEQPFWVRSFRCIIGIKAMHHREPALHILREMFDRVGVLENDRKRILENGRKSRHKNETVRCKNKFWNARTNSRRNNDLIGQVVHVFWEGNLFSEPNLFDCRQCPSCPHLIWTQTHWLKPNLFDCRVLIAK